eukprot:3863168-Prymnesium_polylepis.1
MPSCWALAALVGVPRPSQQSLLMRPAQISTGDVPDVSAVDISDILPAILGGATSSSASRPPLAIFVYHKSGVEASADLVCGKPACGAHPPYGPDHSSRDPPCAEARVVRVREHLDCLRPCREAIPPAVWLLQPRLRQLRPCGTSGRRDPVQRQRSVPGRLAGHPPAPQPVRPDAIEL